MDSFSNVSGATGCTPCLLGKYVKKTEAGSYTTVRTGSLSCDSCVSGFYRDGLGCFACPEGTDCSNASHRSLGSLKVKKHWYRFSDSASETYSCEDFGSYNCRGGLRSYEESCDSNAEGPLCALCKPSFFHNSYGKCVPCEGGAVTKSLAPLIAVISFVILLVGSLRTTFMKRFVERAKRWLSANTMHIEWTLISCRIILFDFQVVAAFTSLNSVTWPFP